MLLKKLPTLGLATAMLSLVTVSVRANNAIVATIQNAASGTTVNVSGTLYRHHHQDHRPERRDGQGTGHVPVHHRRVGGQASTSRRPTHNVITLDEPDGDRGRTMASSCYEFPPTASSPASPKGNQNTGIEFIGRLGRGATSVNNCQGKQNADNATGGGNADGFGCKQGASSGNKFTNCDAHQNSDDGWDLEKSSSPVTISGCTSYNEGSWAGLVGNGNGFKLGIAGDGSSPTSPDPAPMPTTTAKDDSAHGIAANHNTGKIQITSCHTYNNKNADDLGNAVVTNSTLQ